MAPETRFRCIYFSHKTSYCVIELLALYITESIVVEKALVDPPVESGISLLEKILSLTKFTRGQTTIPKPAWADSICYQRGVAFWHTPHPAIHYVTLDDNYLPIRLLRFNMTWIQINRNGEL